MMVMLLKLICRYNAIPIRISSGFFVEIDKLISKICYIENYIELQWIHNSPNKLWKKKTKLENSHLLISKLIHKIM